MAGPIYKLFMLKPTEAYYQLSEEERNGLMAESQADLETVDAKAVLMCFSGWSTEQWAVFGVEQFPDIEAVQKHAELLFGHDQARWFESFSMLGTEWPPS